jgi:hypothetical protein
MAFDEPQASAGNGVRRYEKDLIGNLLLVWVIDYIEYSATRFTKPGDRADAVVVDFVVLDELDPETKEPGLLCQGTWWRGGKIIQGLKSKVGNTNPLLVKMAKESASPGSNAAYILQSQTQVPFAVQAANAWLQAHPDLVLTVPVPQAPRQEDLADPWAGQAEPEIKRELPPERPAPVVPAREETYLERVARLAQSQQAAADRIGAIQGKQPDKPPF